MPTVTPAIRSPIASSALYFGSHCRIGKRLTKFFLRNTFFASNCTMACFAWSITLIRLFVVTDKSILFYWNFEIYSQNFSQLIKTLNLHKKSFEPYDEGFVLTEYCEPVTPWMLYTPFSVSLTFLGLIPLSAMEKNIRKNSLNSL